jgi:mannose/fructose/N-acetylgalactosamine-specific phosphotransferase system component IIC
MIVEMIWTNAVPMGASVPPDLCAISILSVVWANKYFPGLTSAAVLALAFALPFGYLCRGIEIVGRKMNTRIMRWLERGVEAGKYSRISIAVYAGLLLFIFRFFIFYLLSIPIGGWIYCAVYMKAPYFVLIGLAKAWFLLPILGLGTIAYNFSLMRNRWIKK